MTILTVTAKGQVTLKREVLRHLGVAPGDKLEVELLPDRRAVIRERPPQGSMESFVGVLHDNAGTVLGLDEIKSAIEAGWAGERS
ncbi:MAG: AbrB/MazE/SpoVT family DNA-binding domain-containing protein [Propionibacteriaceae bacterium]|jgi:bifunctional DNA-binding transcriptional regulator/antitoxin component of YhaV-PrlF toxin-antitoxin module|nr:AbrB/MazE/SpoVT family DNA-binding domain-containing protein [Propionibacteriaceae bacterium]